MSEYLVADFTTDTKLVIRTWNYPAKPIGIKEKLGVINSFCGKAITEIWPNINQKVVRILHNCITTGRGAKITPKQVRFMIPTPPSKPSASFPKMQQKVLIKPLRENKKNSVVGLHITVEDVTQQLEQAKKLAIAWNNSTAKLEIVKAIAPLLEISSDSKNVLIAALAEENWQVRRIAIEALQQEKDQTLVTELLHLVRTKHQNLSLLNSIIEVLKDSKIDTLPKMLECLTDDDHEVRFYIAQALGEKGDKRAIPGLIKCLDDPVVTVRYHTIEALGQLQATAAVEKLVKIAQSRDFFLAFPALAALMRIGDASISSELLPLLEDDILWEPTASALAQLGEADVVFSLVELLNNVEVATSPIAKALAMLYNRYESTYGFGIQISGLVNKAISVTGKKNLLSALEQASGEEKIALVLVLSWLNGQEVEKAMVGLLSEEKLRTIVIAAIGRYDTQELPEYLKQEEFKSLFQYLIGELNNKKSSFSPLILDSIISVAGINKLLNSEEPELIIAGVKALGRLGGVVPQQVFDLLGHSHPGVRTAAMNTINTLRPPELSERLLPLFAEENFYLQENAIRIAGYFALPEYQNFIRSVACYGAEKLRAVAMEQLPYLGGGEIDLKLIFLGLQKQQKAKVRAAAIRSLAQMDGVNSLPHLLAGLEDPDFWVRYYAIHGIERVCQGKPYENAVFQKLAHLLQTETVNPVLLAATKALGNSGNPQAVQLLAPLIKLEDPENEELTTTAIAALGKLPFPTALAVILPALSAANQSIRITTLTALGTLGSKEAIEAIKTHVSQTQDPLEQQTGLNAIAKVDNTDALDSLLELTTNKTLRPYCIAEAAKTKGLKHLTVLGEKLKHPLPEVRSAVVEILTHLKHPQASEFLITALEDACAQVRLAAIKSLSLLGNRHADSFITAMADRDPDFVVRRAAKKHSKISQMFVISH